MTKLVDVSRQINRYTYELLLGLLEYIKLVSIKVGGCLGGWAVRVEREESDN